MGRAPNATMLLIAVAAAVAAGVAGYVIGHRNHKAAFAVGPGIVYAGKNEGTAYVGTDEPLDRQPRGFAYFFPANVPWIDAADTIHEGGQRPTCVPMYQAVHVKEIEAVKYPISGANMGTVLWVRC